MENSKELPVGIAAVMMGLILGYVSYESANFGFTGMCIGNIILLFLGLAVSAVTHRVIFAIITLIAILISMFHVLVVQGPFM